MSSYASNYPGYDPNTIYTQQEGAIRVPNLIAMTYKNYKWPHNPSLYNIQFSKRYVEHKFMGINNAEIEDMGMEARVMTGSGAFFGPNAYTEFQKLASVFYDKGPGPLIHPVWQEANCLFSKLSLKQEPLPDYVEYDFEFVEHIEINVIEELVIESSSNGGSSSGVVASADSITHVVKQGETLSGIGAKYGVSWRQIATDNKSIINNPNNLSIGWELIINSPKKKPTSQASSSRSSTSSPSSSGTGDAAYDRFMRDFGDTLGG